MREVIQDINCFFWADWTVKKIDLLFDEVIIYLTCDDLKGIEAKLVSTDYIGFNLIGHWDESIVDNIQVSSDGDFINQCLEEVKSKYGGDPITGGIDKKLDSVWCLLTIRYADGIRIQIVSKEIKGYLFNL